VRSEEGIGRTIEIGRAGACFLNDCFDALEEGCVFADAFVV